MLDRRLANMGKVLLLARVKEPVRALLAQLDPDGLGQTARIYWSVADAVYASIPIDGAISHDSRQPTR